MLSLSCDDYPWGAGTSGVVTASSSWATDGALTVTGTLDILLSAGDADTSFALDGLRFYFEGAPDIELEIVSLELDESQWPVVVAAGTSEGRRVGFTLRRPPPDLPPADCPASLIFGVDIEVLADGEVSPYPVSFATVHTCEGCTADAGIGIPVEWEAQPANPFFAVRDIEVDATQAVWLLGPMLDNTGIMAQVITPAGAGASVQISSFGEAEIASGSLPGIIMVSRSDTGFTGGFGGGGGGGAGGAGGAGLGIGGFGGAGGSPEGPALGAPSILVARYDAQGQLIWGRELTGSDTNPTVASFSGHVLVAIASSDGLYADGEVLDPAGGDYLVLFDEETGEVVRFSAGFSGTAIASTGDGAVVFGHPSDAIDVPELRLLDTELITTWSTEVSANGITLFAELAAAGDVFYVYDPAAGLVMRRTSNGSSEWDSSVALGATTLAALPEGGALLGGTGIAMQLDGQGVVTDLTRNDGEPSWCVGPFPEYGFASGGNSPAFVFTDPSFASLRVGRLAL